MPDVRVTDPRITVVLSALEIQPWRTLAELSDVVQLSPSRLRHLFRNETGTSISCYTLELRLERARVLLTTTFQPIKVIRHEVGIPDGPNFAVYFKRRFRMTPSAYRKAFRSRLDQQIAVYTNNKPLSEASSLTFTNAAPNETLEH